MAVTGMWPFHAPARLYSNSSGEIARPILSIGRSVRSAQLWIKAELPIHTAVAGSPARLSSSTLTSESLPPPIGTRVRRGKPHAVAGAALAPGFAGKRMRSRRSSLL